MGANLVTGKRTSLHVGIVFYDDSPVRTGMGWRDDSDSGPYTGAVSPAA